MKCPECLFDNREGARFCKECGNELDLVCPSCGRSSHPDSLFCDECGYDLRKPEQPAPAGYTEPRSYTPPFLAERILTTRSSIEGERKLVTVLFADVANYTAISEKLDPEEIHDIMDGCFKILMDDIHQYEGTINQFTGDGVMGLFGAPIAHEDHAERALHAALEIQTAIGKYGKEVEQRWGVSFKFRLGLNTGRVVVGRIGDNLRMDYTASGDTTNLAARLQQMAPAGAIWVGEATYRLAESAFEWRAIGPMEVKGKAEPVLAYELIGRRVLKNRFEVLAQRGLTRFAGRKSELSRLRTLFTKAEKGQGQAVGIQGEAGVGKSRLLYEFRKSLAPNVLYLEGQCVPYGGASAYQPLIGVLRQHWSLPEQINEQVSGRIAQQLNGLREYLPCFEDLLSLPSSDRNYVHLSPQMRRMKTFAALIGLFQQAAADQPLVLAIEDLQWIDQTSQEFIGTLLDALTTSRILLVLLSRPEFQPPWQEHACYTDLSLPLLPESEGQHLVQALFDAPVAPEVEEYILGHTEGNPFFAEELTRTLRETQALKRNGYYTLALPAGELKIPETVHGVLGARIDRMDDETKYTLQVASVIGREFTVPILRKVLGGNGKLQAQLELLSEMEFVYPQKPADSIYLFKHALTRDVAYETLLRRVRRPLHQQVADSIEELLPEIKTAHPEILAHHYTEAELPNQAIPYWQQAGQKAIQRSANAEAISHLTKGLELLKTLPDTPERAQQELILQNTMGVALLQTKGLGAPEVGRSYARARELCQRVGETPSLLFPSLWGLYVFHMLRGDMQRMEDLGKQLLSIAMHAQDSTFILQAHHALGMTSFHMALFLSAQEHLEQAITLYDLQQHGSLGYLYGFDPVVSSMCYSNMALCHLGYPDQAVKRMQECLGLAQEIDHKLSLAYAQAVRAMIHQYRGEAKATQEWAETAMTVSNEYGFPHWLAWTNVLRGWAVAMQGQSEEGIPQIRSGLDLHRSIGSKISLPTELAHLAEAYLSGNQAEEGLTAIEEAFDEVHTRGEAWWSAELHRLKASLLLSLSDKNQAEAEFCFREAIAVAKEQNTKYFELLATTSLARVLQKQGRDAEAKKMLSEIYDWFTEGFDTAALKEAKALLEELS